MSDKPTIPTVHEFAEAVREYGYKVKAMIGEKYGDRDHLIDIVTMIKLGSIPLKNLLDRYDAAVMPTVEEGMAKDAKVETP